MGLETDHHLIALDETRAHATSLDASAGRC